MGSARGIAGSTRPEAAGIFLCSDAAEAEYFVRLNNTGGPVDVWVVEGFDITVLMPNGSGHFYLPGPIASDQVRLFEAARDASASDD